MSGDPVGAGPARPSRIVLVCGTGTEVGKTWVSAELLAALRRRGLSVAARKPAQSFDVDTAGRPAGGPTDAEVLAGSSGEAPDEVCPPGRSYHLAMAPPMAAEALGRPVPTVAGLVAGLGWPRGPVAVGLVETAGGVRSPQAADGDVTDLSAALGPDLTVLVADAGLGTINGVRLSVEALAAGPGRAAPGAGPAGAPTGRTAPVVVVLNRFDPGHDLHRRNRRWLSEGPGPVVLTSPGELDALAALAAGDGPGPVGGVRPRGLPRPAPPG